MVASIRLAGSSRRFHLPAATDPDQRGPLTGAALAKRAAVTVHLREAAHSQTLPVRLAWRALGITGTADHLSSAELRQAHGAGFDDVTAVAAWAVSCGLDLGSVDQTTRRLELRGSLGALADAFLVRLEERRTLDWRTGGDLVYRDHREELRIPRELDGVISAVIGLSDRPVARPRIAVRGQAAPGLAAFTPERLAELYGFPVLDGGGAGHTITVGIAELGGAVDPDDLRRARLAMPRLRVVEEGVDGARPRRDPFGADTEVALDWQVIAGVLHRCAPEASVELIVRYAPNTERGFTDVLASFADDGRDYAAVSTSWGSPEDLWTPAALDAMDRAFQMGAVRGTVHCVAAGDNGSSDARRDGRAHADHPASAPHAVGCGGTTLTVRGDGSMVEVAWNEVAVDQGAGGGGVSAHFPTPHYQASAGIAPRSANDGRPGRGAPDVAGNADPLTGYRIVHEGAEVVVGGTSAVAPLWSALFALASTAAGHPLGLVHPILYAARSRAFRDVTVGDNGAYRAAPGWDPVTGLGTPDGHALAAALAEGTHVRRDREPRAVASSTQPTRRARPVEVGGRELG